MKQLISYSYRQEKRCSGSMITIKTLIWRCAVFPGFDNEKKRVKMFNGYPAEKGLIVGILQTSNPETYYVGQQRLRKVTTVLLGSLLD